MDELRQCINAILQASVDKIIISKPALKSESIRKITIDKMGDKYQIAKYTDKQVFHENLAKGEVADRFYELVSGNYRQINGISEQEEHIVLISKKGQCNYKVQKKVTGVVKPNTLTTEHNRKKNYILQEGMKIEPLVDMGVFTQDGKVINAKYDKYKQINRFIEILDDEISKMQLKKLNVIDFGCGKSYLTFVVYYYLTEVMHLEVNMVGLDLKADVIESCNVAARKYHYDNLHFELGDIKGYDAPFDVDMVITLHACDTATDYALFNAIQWNARMIFSVPCCQHELNGQIAPDTLKILSRYGILKERFSAIATDAIRGNLLEYCGYKTQLLEFIDFDHTPKNILIRAIKRPTTSMKGRERYLTEVQVIMKEFEFTPTLFNLLNLKK